MSHQPTVLIVDDDEDFLLVARRALQRARVAAEVRVARDGGEVLRLLGIDGKAEPTPPPRPPAVVLLDLSMPVLGGFEVLRRIRAEERTRTVPVVVVSSSNRPDDIRRSYELGANSFVVKRYDPASPGGYLAEAARYWLRVNEPPPGRERPWSSG